MVASMANNMANKMSCPHCGAEMNHHGDKLVYAADAAGGPKIDLGLGGFVEEFHSCPKCGAAASRLPED